MDDVATRGAAGLIGRLGALADETRGRVLLLLERHELSVTELCGVLQLPQSTVSRHLRLLGEEGWIVWRAEGASRYYRMSTRLDAPARRLWRAVRESMWQAVSGAHDLERARQVLSQRRTRSEEFFSTAAGQWASMRQELFGDRADAIGLLALLDERWVVGDLGCGTGRLSALLAPFVARVIGVDRSRAMLSAARRESAGLHNIELRQGELEALPIEGGALDAAVLALVLHYAAEPVRVLEEARRTLRPGGRLLIVDMVAHNRGEYRERMGHVWLGFDADQLGDWLGEAGFGRLHYRQLPPDPQAKGPLLFAAAAVAGRRARQSARSGG